MHNSGILIRENTTEKLRISFVPPIGGSSIGCKKATGVNPTMSYSAFDKNDRHLRAYWDEVPYLNRDKRSMSSISRVSALDMRLTSWSRSVPRLTLRLDNPAQGQIVITELHGLLQRRVRTFYFFWKSPSVSLLTWKKIPHKSSTDYLAEIPESATLQTIYKWSGKASESYVPYKFVLV